MSSLKDEDRDKIAYTIARLHSWLETMRGPDGYGGPISHWWESSLIYCGPMADWRYEGIICGYLSLYRSTGDHFWLNSAKRAGDDLVAAQLPTGNFRNSSFQQGPMEGGTPHEAAVDVGLLELAQILQELGDEDWNRYFKTAETNISHYSIGKLWNGKGFRDQPWNETLVPNKNGTTIEALVLYERISGIDMSEYLEGAARVILGAQEKRGLRAGGTIHLGTGKHQLAVGIYTARSMSGLLRLFERDEDHLLLDTIALSKGFFRGLFTSSGVYFGRYRDGSLISNPRLIAGAGDILRTMIWGQKYDLFTESDIQPLVELFVGSQFPSGGIPTAYGFSQRGSRRAYQGLPDFRDCLPVAGWCDKAFRALAMICPDVPKAEIDDMECECVWKERLCKFCETSQELSLTDIHQKKMIYRWRKKDDFASIYRL